MFRQHLKICKLTTQYTFMPMLIKYLQSPNLSERKQDAVIDTIIIHHTNMISLQAAIDRLCDRQTNVSSHYVISTNGDIYQLVPEEYKAYHAGDSHWRSRQNLNDYSLGIELENIGTASFPEAQIHSLIKLCHDISSRHEIDSRNILGHFDIAPSRKNDPNHYFPWRQLAQNGVGIFPKIDTPDNNQLMEADLCQKLSQYGYHLGSNNELKQDVIIAFKRHFCPETFATPDWDLLANARLNKLIEMING